MEQNIEIIQEENIKNNELDLFFYCIWEAFPHNYKDGVRDYYIIFKKTEENDTIFLFSYYYKYFPKPDEVGYQTIYPSIDESGYQGYVSIDTFRVAIFDESISGIELYRDKINTESTTFERKEGERVHLFSTGFYKNGKLEDIDCKIQAQQGLNWGKYFK